MCPTKALNKLPATLRHVCLGRRLTAASPAAGLGPLSPPHCGQPGLASGSSGSSSSVGGAAWVGPPWQRVAQSLQTELEGRLHLHQRPLRWPRYTSKKRTCLPHLRKAAFLLLLIWAKMYYKGPGVAEPLLSLVSDHTASTHTQPLLLQDVH